MTTPHTLALALALGILGLPAVAQTAAGKAAATAPQVRILAPADGAIVTSPFELRFQLQGMAVRPAGDMTEGTGHHHLLIDQDAMPAGESIPMTPLHLHFGKGQTEARIELPPGSYKLTAQFANGAHQSYGQALAHTIRITVRPGP